MKPTKNKHFCSGCGRYKMLFESEAKANNFIKFNGNEILEETGKAPVRSYYCEFCGGYHVTSKESPEEGELLDNRDRRIMSKVDLISKSKQNYKQYFPEISKKTGHARTLIIEGNFDEAQSLLEESAILVEDLKKIAPSQMGKLIAIQQRINAFNNTIKHWEEWSKKSIEEITDWINSGSPSTEKDLIKKMLDYRIKAVTKNKD